MKRESILAHMARTLFVSTFADACDDSEAFPGFDARGQEAGPGEDWFDTVTDPTPPQAEEKAREIAADFEARNDWPLEVAGEQWASTPGQCYRMADDEAFGFRLAMQALGHGVGLWDDVAEREGFKIGLFDFGAWNW